MNIEQETIEPGIVQLTITVDEERVEKAKKQAARSLSREVTVPGFRRGRAPYSLMAQYLGESRLLEYALEDLAPTVITEAIEEADLEVWNYEEVEPNLDSVDPLILKVLIPIAPHVELADIDEIDVELEAIEVDESDVEKTVERLREERATLIPTVGPAEYGDVATIDLHGERLDGVVVANMEGSDVTLQRMYEDEEDESAGNEIILPGQTSDEQTEHRPDLMAELTGMRVNETKRFTLAYPEDWHDERLAGRTIMYEAKLLDLKKKALPELDEAFAREVGDFESVEALRERIREGLEAEATSERNSRVLNDIVDTLVERSEIVYPQSMVDDWIEAKREQTESQLHMYNLTIDQFLEMTDQTRDEFEAELRDAAIKDLERGLILTEYAYLHDFKITPEEMQREIGIITSRLDRQGLDETVLQSESAQQEVAEQLLTRKILNRLWSEVTGEPEPALFPVTEEDVMEDEEVLEDRLAIELQGQNVEEELS